MRHNCVSPILFTLALGAGAARAQTAPATLVIYGLVTDKATGQPVADARVSIVGYDGESNTSATGRFALRGAREAGVEIRVQRIGYREVQRQVSIGDSARVRVDIALEPAPAELSAVVTSASASATARLLESTGFTARRNRGIGHFGDRDEIERTKPTSVRMFFHQYVRGCTMIFIDGVPLRGLSDITLDEIAGYEWYSHNAQAPPAWVNKMADCGSLIVWTRIPE